MSRATLVQTCSFLSVADDIWPDSYDEEFAPAQLPQLQNLQPPQRAMSPTERAREAEQLQEKQRIIAQNRKAAIEKRQRLTNRQSGEKPVSI